MAINIGGVLAGNLKIPYPPIARHNAQHISEMREGIDKPLSPLPTPPRVPTIPSGANKNDIYYILTKIISEHIKFSPLKP